MSFKIRPTPARDVTRELRQAFQLSNLCRELVKTKILPGTKRQLGKQNPTSCGVEETPGDYDMTGKQEK